MSKRHNLLSVDIHKYSSFAYQKGELDTGVSCSVWKMMEVDPEGTRSGLNAKLCFLIGEVERIFFEVKNKEYRHSETKETCDA